MPARFLRPAIRQSKRWNRVPYIAQSLYIRLLTLVDDFARYDADTELLRSETFPYGDPDGNQHDLLAIDGALLALADKNMLVLYEVDGHRYLQLTRWQERKRSNSKWPKPPKEVVCEHLTTGDNICTPPTPSPSPCLERVSVERPSLQEVLDYAVIAGLAPWKATDWFREMEGCGWMDHNRRPIVSWKPVLARVRTKWEADGRPNGPPARVKKSAGNPHSF